MILFPVILVLPSPFFLLTAIPTHSHTHLLAPTAVALPIELLSPYRISHMYRMVSNSLISHLTLRHADLLSSLHSRAYTSASQHSLQSRRRVSCSHPATGQALNTLKFKFRNPQPFYTIRPMAFCALLRVPTRERRSLAAEYHLPKVFSVLQAGRTRRLHFP